MLGCAVKLQPLQDTGRGIPRMGKLADSVQIIQDNPHHLGLRTNLIGVIHQPTYLVGEVLLGSALGCRPGR